MLKFVLKKIFKILQIAVLLIVGFFVYFNLPVKTPENDFDLGVTFSSRYAQDIGLDWREAYLAILDDLGVRKIRVVAYWDLIEREEGKYDFSDVDFQLQEAQKRNAEIVLAIGQKVPRWPECHIPQWAKEDDGKRKEGLIEFVETAVDRYKGNKTIKYWQVENEPFLNFGICPVLDVELLDKEIATVKSKDSRPVIITDSGELSLWVQSARRADVFGTTLYREVYSQKAGGYWKYPIGPNFFKFKQWIIKKFAKQENIIIVELQGEPWIGGWTVDFPLEKQFESMNEEKLEGSVKFARKTGFEEAYLWGAEWWYWLKIKENNPQLWEKSKALFSEY